MDYDADKQYKKLGFLEAQNEDFRQQIQDLENKIKGHFNMPRQLQYVNMLGPGPGVQNRGIPAGGLTSGERCYKIGFLEYQNNSLQQQIKDLKAKLQEQQQQQQLQCANIPNIYPPPPYVGGQNRNGQIQQQHLKTEFNEAESID